MQRPLVFAIHDARGEYWPYLGVALHSVLRCSAAPQSVWVLHDSTLSDVAKAKLGSLCGQHRASLTLMHIRLPQYLASANFGAFSPASIFRLAIPQLFKDHDQVVYLDSDLIFHGVDVAELVGAVADASFAAVVDPYIWRPQKHRDQLAALGLDPSQYFNSGVLVMRPKELPDDLIARFQDFCKQHPVMSHPDQDFLNVQFKGNWKPLPGRFNEQACAFDRSLFRPLRSYEGKVIHYAGKLKPLQGGLAPAFVPFWMYAAAIPEAAKVFDQAPISLLEPDPKKPDGVLIRRLNHPANEI